MQLLVPACDEPGLYTARGPDGLSGLHPSWASDIERFGPVAGPAQAPLFALGDRLVFRGPDREGPVLVAVSGTDSTMDLFWALSGTDVLPPFTAVAAGEQSTGRGQLRRAWSSPPGNLHVTFALPQPVGPRAREWNRLLPLVAGEFIASVLEQAAGRPVSLKWPNDLVVDGRKVAGVLLEERGERLAVGLGVNLVHAPEHSQLREDHALEAGILPLSGPVSTPLTLWRALESQLLFEYAGTFERSDPMSFISRIQGRLLWLGRPILYTDGNKEVLAATLAGLSPDGGLRLRTSGGRERVVYSGCVSPGGKTDVIE